MRGRIRERCGVRVMVRNGSENKGRLWVHNEEMKETLRRK